jgi:aromatic-L-amino-acid decarboxylase
VYIRGLEAFRTALDEKLDLTQHLWEELKNMDGVEVAPAPHLSVLAFRVNFQNDVEADNHMTKILVERVNSDRDLLISTTSNDDKIYARIAIMSARTRGAIANELVTKIRQSLSKLVE